MGEKASQTAFPAAEKFQILDRRTKTALRKARDHSWLEKEASWYDTRRLFLAHSKIYLRILSPGCAYSTCMKGSLIHKSWPDPTQTSYIHRKTYLLSYFQVSELREALSRYQQEFCQPIHGSVMATRTQTRPYLPSSLSSYSKTQARQTTTIPL